MADMERRLLLDDDIEDNPTPVEQRMKRATPLPKAQLAVVFAAKLGVTLSAQQATPYLNEMLGRLSGGRSSRVGFAAGLVWTAYCAPQLLGVYPWGRTSDRVGRVPVLLVATVGLAIASFTFGFSNKHLWAVAFTRFLVGLFCGSVGVMHSVVGELTDKTNASKAFPLYDTVAAVGFIIGPLLGGFLANPATAYPGWFQSTFWAEYPYILPSAVAGVYALFASALSLFTLHETNPRDERLTSSSAVRTTEDGLNAKQPPPGLRELLAHPMMRYISLASGGVGLLGATFNVLFVLIAYSPVDEGGLALSPAKIAIALSIMGFVAILLKLSLPLVLTRYPTLSVFRFALRSFVATFAALPLLNLLVRQLEPSPGRPAAQDAVLWFAIGTVLFLSRLGCLGFGLVMLLVREHTPDAHALGAANGATELVQQLGMLMGPPFVTSLFAFSTTRGVLGGYLWVPFVLSAAVLISRLVDVMIRLQRVSMARTD